MVCMEKTSDSRYKLKKIVKMLSSIRGRHTEMVSVYVPAGYSLHEITSQLKQEQGTADNIKSKQVRKNVVSALERILRHIQLYKKTPDNGVAFFAGNISEKEGASDIELWALEPPEPIKTKLYWCDQTFVTEPLEKMVEEKEIYGIINLDKSEAEIGLIRGKKIESFGHFESIVPGKTRAGGQSSQRFSRIREGLLNDWLKHIGEASNKVFENRKDVIGIIVSGPGPIKDMFMKEEYLHADVKKRVIGTVDTSYTGEPGLHETLERGEDLLKDASVIKEKKLLQRFFTELQKPGGLVTYGITETMRYLEMGAVDMVIVSEDSDILAIEYIEDGAGKIKFVSAEKRKEAFAGRQGVEIMGEEDIIEFFEKKVKAYGSKLEVVSSETREGAQFAALGGVGALLRYNV